MHIDSKFNFFNQKSRRHCQSRRREKKTQNKSKKEKQHLLILNSDFATPNRIIKPHLMTE